VTTTIPVYLECGSKRTFAGALDWPGWCRSGRTEEQALATLEEYAARYRVVPELAGLAFPAAGATPAFEVVERLTGDASTDFGAPGAIPAADHSPPSAVERARLAALLDACWDVFGQVVATAPPTLRKGPRGGGRDRDAIVEHVVRAEAAYARRVGISARSLDPSDVAAVSVFRRELADAIARPVPRPIPTQSSGGRPPAKTWPLRYATRRIAWHVLDHAWEIEDKSE
jgi:hypothetical protein